MVLGWWWLVVLTVVFLAAALSYAVAACTASGWERTSSWSVHAVGAVVMAGMMWPIGMTVSPVIYLLLFTAAALFVVFVGLFRGAVAHWPHHALLMAAMAMMLITMAPRDITGTGVAMPEHGHSMAMPMGPSAPVGAPPWLRVSAAALAALMFLSTAACVYLVVRGPQRPYADVLMAAGMGVYFALCI